MLTGEADRPGKMLARPLRATLLAWVSARGTAPIWCYISILHSNLLTVAHQDSVCPCLSS